MKKVILIDGNNLMFRSYFATAYNGNLMKNSKGEATNALYGFVTMLNKIINEEKPNYMAVAFDIGKNFRHAKYSNYKAGRNATPDDLKSQMVKVHDLLTAMGIKYIEVENYEADDIIGTLSVRSLNDPNFNATIISSDKDLLQLINKEVDVKLLKTKDYIRYNEETFEKDYGIEPIKMIDLKALMGDASDNVPGVKGIGEKTALKLLQEYGSLENIYANIDKISGSVKSKLETDRESAFFSKEICTIYLDVPIKETLEDLKYSGPTNKLKDIFEELEFYSFLKNMEIKNDYSIEFQEINNINDLKKTELLSYYIEASEENYHQASALGMGLYDGKKVYYVNKELIPEVMEYIKDIPKYTYDLKKNIVLLNDFSTNTIFDTMIATYLLNYQIKDDLAVLMNKEGIYVPFYNEIIKDKSKLKMAVASKAKYIFDTHDKLISSLKLDDMYDLFETIEMPLIKVLAQMEMNGIICKASSLFELKDEINSRLQDISNHVYEFTGEVFNISSPKQVGEVLFEHMKLPYPHRKTPGKNYHTDSDTLEKLIIKYPVIGEIIEYRNLVKLMSTYLDGLTNYIMEDGKIHTIFKQTITRTGRLSSAEPNLQNIPTRDEFGKRVRKAFLPENDLLLSADYSQIELRVLAHISNSKELIEAFKNGEDIHTQVASDIFEVPISEVTKKMRRTAKAVIFGIVYGISGFGLGENLKLSPIEAKTFIDKYLKLYPGVKDYMKEIVNEAKIYGSVRTLFNRKRVIDEINNTNYVIRSQGERMALNTPIQGTSADIIKMAMIKINDEMIKQNFKSKMILQVHDELIFDCLEEEKEALEKLVVNIMENIVELKVPLKVSVDCGPNWFDTK